MTTSDDDLDDDHELSAAPREGAGEGPVVIEVRGVDKTFCIPDHRIDSIKERVMRPFTRVEYREHRAVQRISFDVHKGEFFGIVGRNGSGKSTLLKILASIYRADAGKVRTAGRVAPFIELGVGFNPELTSRENGLLNGVLMGLSRREARHRLDAVLDFAELKDFTDLKIKNYSSGMTVRLAFAIMVQADADIMLIDEVLAVGDAAFGQKCMDVFHERRRAGKTIVLVTHDMGTVQDLCHRAMLIHDGEMRYIGDPEDTARRYYRLNFTAPVEPDAEMADMDMTAVPDFHARVIHAGLRDRAGELVENLEQDQPFIVDVVIEASRELDKPIFVFHLLNADHVVVFGFTRTLEQRVAAGQRVHLSGEIENRLVSGRYSLGLWIRRDQQGGDMAVQGLKLCSFVVFGTAPRHGLVALQTDIEAVLQAGSGS